MQLVATPAAPSLTPKPPMLPTPGATPAAPASAAAPAGAPKGGPAGPKGAKPDLAALVGMPVADAVKAATTHLTKLSGMTVGGGTKDGAAAAMGAASLLKDTSMLVQVIHRNAVPTHISPELEMNLMAISTGMAAASTQVALMGQASKQPIALKEMLQTPTKAALDVLATVADHVARQQQQAANPSTAGYL